MIIDFHFMVS